MLVRLAFIGGLALTIFVVGKAANLVTGVRATQSNPPVMMMERDDPLMNAAHDKARGTIGDFWAALDRKQPNEKNFALKVRFPVKGHGDSGEHVWVTDARRLAGGTYSGRLDNKPKFLPEMKIGDRVKFSDDMISDWMFTRNGKIVGNERMRPMLARLPKAKADQLRTMLENP